MKQSPFMILMETFAFFVMNETIDGDLSGCRGDTVRASLITYADDARVEFYLNDYNEKRDILNALSFMQRGGRTNTQEALRKSNEDVLVSSR